MRGKLLGIAALMLLFNSLVGTVHGGAPFLVLSSVKISPPSVMVGSVFVAEMLVVNLGSLAALTATLTLELAPISGAYFSIVSSGTVLNIGELQPGANMTLSASIAVSYEARTGTYDIPYMLTYSDESRYSYNNTGTFGVMISGTPDVQIQSATVDPVKLSPITDGTLSISFINIGTENAHDISVRIYNDGGLLTSTVSYIGSLPRGAVNTIGFGIHVDPDAAIGTRLVNITVTYKDPSGNDYVTSKIYDLKVYALEPLIPLYDLGLIAGALFFAALLYLSFRRVGHRFW